VAGAIEEVDAEGHGADVEVLVLEHLEGRDDFLVA
jgi:hypothetical protein